MAELLIEIRSEEIPAGMQTPAQETLVRLLAGALDEAALGYTAIDCFSTPRRLVARVDGLPARQPDTREERRGPKIDAPERAIEGFLKSAGLERGQAEERET